MSSRAFRVRGLKPDTTIDQLQDLVEPFTQTLTKHRVLPNPFVSSVSQTSLAERPICSVARQDDFATATVLCASSERKVQAIRRLADSIKDCEVDCNFDGLTVLHTADNAEIE